MGDAPLAIVLAAGLSTRMKSKTPKVLHPVAGRPLVTHILRTVRAVGARPLVVLSKESAAARELFDEGTRVAIQDVARGTGDAVRVALAAANGDRGVAFIVYGDTRSEEHTSELQSLAYLVCRLLLEKKKGGRTTVPRNRISGAGPPRKGGARSNLTH